MTDSATTRQEDDANARLIAKAPEMAALLREVSQPLHDRQTTAAKARALLREIEGQP